MAETKKPADKPADKPAAKPAAPAPKGPDNDLGFNKANERIADVFDEEYGTVAKRQEAEQKEAAKAAK